MQVSTQPFLSTVECVSKSFSIFGSLSVLLKWDNTYSAQGPCEASIKCLWKSSWYKYKGSGFSVYFRKLLCSMASWLLFGCLPVCLSIYLSSIVLSVYLSMHLCIYHFICQLSISHSFYCCLVGMSMWVYKWISSYPLFRIFEHLCFSSVSQVFIISSVFFRVRNHFSQISYIYTNASYEAQLCFFFKGWYHVHLKEICRQLKVLCYKWHKGPLPS